MGRGEEEEEEEEEKFNRTFLTRHVKLKTVAFVVRNAFFFLREIRQVVQ